VPKLRDSHLLPKALYKLARNVSGREVSDPIIVGGGRSVPSSQQGSQPLLCAGCEERFSRGGSWMRAPSAKRGSFKLREKLAGAPTLRLPRRDVLVYNLDTSFPEAADQLAYFAASVFWRSAAGKWRFGSRVLKNIQMGPYLEDFRRHLLGEAV